MKWGCNIFFKKKSLDEGFPELIMKWTNNMTCFPKIDDKP